MLNDLGPVIGLNWNSRVAASVSGASGESGAKSK